MYFYAPAAKLGGEYSFALVRTHVHTHLHTYVKLCSIVRISAAALRVFDAGFETFNIAQAYIGHVHKGNGILIQSLLQNISF